MNLKVLAIALTILAGVSAAQQTPAPKPLVDDEAQLPPEEDKAQKPREYSFNPVQSRDEVRVGEFYFKSGDFSAAVVRFREATKWNDGNSEAWLLLAETEEKNRQLKAASDAYEKYLDLAPDAKNAPSVKKKLETLKALLLSRKSKG
jgi:tetratricopeptide (TPR) repeat protein